MSKHIYPPDPSCNDYKDLYTMYLNTCKKVSSYDVDIEPKGLHLLDGKEMAQSLIHNIDMVHRPHVVPIGCFISKGSAKYYYIRIDNDRLLCIIEIVVPYKDRPYVCTVMENELTQHGALLDVYKKYISGGCVFLRLFSQRKERLVPKVHRSYDTRNHGRKHSIEQVGVVQEQV